LIHATIEADNLLANEDSKLSMAEQEDNLFDAHGVP